ncbi:hypothetical protein SeMB42_g02166 [Synchytrium endobioticum]|uniref:Potassium channel domain-containing protein n=1 Tax=Synchytrium endobioticum TaxID=286115 RepID=A0A507DGI5_9FUNG|nr:hypothetical protein SeLEV6574_g05162 [Synchytrium endobioticum]TPX50723.1 hypothetical protein SeMB42_g02166 [Synchytrium endobioticum]
METEVDLHLPDSDRLPSPKQRIVYYLHEIWQPVREICWDTFTLPERSASRWTTAVLAQLYAIFSATRGLTINYWLLVSQMEGGTPSTFISTTQTAFVSIALAAAVCSTSSMFVGSMVHWDKFMKICGRTCTICSLVQFLTSLAAVATFELRGERTPNSFVSQGWIATVTVVPTSFLAFILLAINWRTCNFQGYEIPGSDRKLIQASAFAVYVILLGGILFHFIVGIPWDSAYQFAIVTLLTIGYGNIVITTVGGRICLIIYSGIGLILIGYFLLAIEDVMVERADKETRKFYERRRKRREGRAAKRKRRREKIAMQRKFLEAKYGATALAEAESRRKSYLQLALELLNKDAVIDPFTGERVSNWSALDATANTIEAMAYDYSLPSGRGPFNATSEDAILPCNSQIGEGGHPVELSKRLVLRDRTATTEPNHPMEIGPPPNFAINSIASNRKIDFIIPNNPRPSRSQNRMSSDSKLLHLSQSSEINHPMSTDDEMPQPLSDYSQGDVDELPLESTYTLTNMDSSVDDDERRENEKDRKHELSRMRQIVFWLIAYWLLGSFVFEKLERSWSYSDATYFTWVTITTIGYGDYYPQSPWSWEFWNLFVFLEVGILSYLLSLVGRKLGKRFASGAFRAERLRHTRVASPDVDLYIESGPSPPVPPLSAETVPQILFQASSQDPEMAFPGPPYELTRTTASSVGETLQVNQMRPARASSRRSNVGSSSPSLSRVVLRPSPSPLASNVEELAQNVAELAGYDSEAEIEEDRARANFAREVEVTKHLLQVVRRRGGSSNTSTDGRRSNGGTSATPSPAIPSSDLAFRG